MMNELPEKEQSSKSLKGNRQGPVFNITDSTITNLTGSGDIHYQEASNQPSSPIEETRRPDETRSVKTILVLAANPKGTSQLRLGEEVRKLQMGLERSQQRNRFRIEQRWAVTVTDLRRALLDCHPQIVHFSGHGVGTEASGRDRSSTRKAVVSGSASAPEGLLFEDETGQSQLVSANALASLFALFGNQVECVVLNACYSAVQAKAIAQHIPYVVGMKRAIGDKAAIEFAIGFYDAVLAGRSVEFAYQLGCTAIQLARIPEHLTPILEQKSG
ncbi:MAG: CHAT domain-containing protein [Leptolyngbyaceae cyanobacterium MO_188.B28]|nr:CHAT domain-containing protein [Leptolyngbyaceae cyanobacterium MO_188.B28]